VQHQQHNVAGRGMLVRGSAQPWEQRRGACRRGVSAGTGCGCSHPASGRKGSSSYGGAASDVGAGRQEAWCIHMVRCSCSLLPTWHGYAAGAVPSSRSGCLARPAAPRAAALPLRLRLRAGAFAALHARRARRGVLCRRAGAPPPKGASAGGPSAHKCPPASSSLLSLLAEPAPTRWASHITSRLLRLLEAGRRHLQTQPSVPDAERDIRVERLSH
jgi:hypothetical protein